MRVVLDTNVFVSGLLRPDGVPGQIVDYLLSGAFVVLYDDRTLGEYREVLARPRLGIPQEDAMAVRLHRSARDFAAAVAALDRPPGSRRPPIR